MSPSAGKVQRALMPAGAVGWARLARPAALLFVLVQLALPAAYFWRRDPHDERFSWRMFSTMRMAQCQPVFRVQSKPVVLHAHFHEAWIELARRGRQGVLDEMAAHLCRRYTANEVELELTCEYLGGARSQRRDVHACAAREP